MQSSLRLSNLSFALISALMWLAFQGSAVADEAAKTDVGREQARALLAKHCSACHGLNKKEGELSISELDQDIVRGPDVERWQEVLDQLNAGAMPPKEKSTLSVAEREQLTAWLTGELKQAAELRKSTGGRTMLRRLTREEYNNTLRDLLGLDLDFAKDLPPESAAELGFQNNSQILVTSFLHLDHFQKIAHSALQKAFGPREKPNPFTFASRGGTLAANKAVTIEFPKFPPYGSVLIRVTASANRSPRGESPFLSVTVGQQGKNVRRTKQVGAVAVEAVAGKPQAYEFLIQAEDFPFTGQQSILVLRNQFDVGTSDLPETNQPALHMDKVEIIAPYYKVWPPETRAKILIKSKSSNNEKVYAREVIEHFMQRAYRRRVTEAEINRMFELFVKLRTDENTAAEALVETLSAVLSSPNFLLLVEPAPDAEHADLARTLTDFELASRLSYFLWSSMPDDTLFALAAQGKLHEDEVLRTQVARMLNDPKGRTFSKRFVTQWLDLGAVDRVAVNPEFFPRFDDDLKPAMREESVRFFDQVLRDNLSCFTLLESDFVVINAALAKHYGIEGVAGDQFRKVKLDPDDHRGGLLTQAGILLAGSTGDDTHPVKRGVWLLERLLNDPPPPPPPEVPTLAQDDRRGERLSLKDKLLAHRNNTACFNCHRKIDPWGLAFENYDAVGRWRDTGDNLNTIDAAPEAPRTSKKKRKKAPERARPVQTIGEVDARTELPDGTRIDGVEELKKYLLANKRERFAETLVSRLLSFAVWRNLEFSDRPAVEKLGLRFRKSDYHLQALITDIVLSDTFRTK